MIIQRDLGLIVNLELMSGNCFVDPVDVLILHLLLTLQSCVIIDHLSAAGLFHLTSGVIRRIDGRGSTQALLVNRIDSASQAKPAVWEAFLHSAHKLLIQFFNPRTAVLRLMVRKESEELICNNTTEICA